MCVCPVKKKKKKKRIKKKRSSSNIIYLVSSLTTAANGAAVSSVVVNDFGPAVCRPPVSVEPPWRPHGRSLVISRWPVRVDQLRPAQQPSRPTIKGKQLQFSINVEISRQEKHFLPAALRLTSHARSLAGHQFHRRRGHRPLPPARLPPTTTTSPGKERKRENHFPGSVTRQVDSISAHAMARYRIFFFSVYQRKRKKNSGAMTTETAGSTDSFPPPSSGSFLTT